MNDSVHGQVRDIIMLLPPELVLMVTAYLDRDDVVNFLQVSKGWRSRLYNKTSMCALVERIFPQLTSAYPIGSADPTPYYCNLFRHGVQQYYSRDHALVKSRLEGKFTLGENSLFDLDPKKVPRYLDPKELETFYRRRNADSDVIPLSTTVRYSDGKIAWITSDGGLVALDDLRTRKRAVYFPCSGLRPLKLAALGDKLVVLTTRGSMV